MKGPLDTNQFRPTRAVIDLKALAHNFRLAQDLAGSEHGLLTIVKANGYGHGALPVAQTLEEHGAAALGVATPREGMELRMGGIKAPIFLLAGPLGAPGDFLRQHELTPVLFNEEQVAHLQSTSSAPLEFHLKVDTGMTRLGVLPKQLEAFLKLIKSSAHLKLSGVLTHLASADETFEGQTADQYKTFSRVKHLMDEKFPGTPVFHIANSAAILGGKLGPYDWGRPGIMLYGANPHPRFEAGKRLKPVMTLRSEIISLKEVNKGAAVSYGGDWVAPRTSRIAVLPIGYGDGYLRSLSNRGEVLIGGRRFPVVGRVCMDLIMLDVTEGPDIQVGSEAILWGKGLPVEEVAEAAGTISYELLCSVSARVPKVYPEKDS